MGPPDASPLHDPRPRWPALAAIAIVAFVVRLLWALAMHVDVRAQFLLDMSVYDLLARRLAAGEGYAGYSGAPMAFFPPGYPAILAGLYSIFGTSLVVAWVANAAFGALTCVLVFAIAARLFDRATGLVAATLLAVFPGDVFSAAFTLSEATFGFLFVAVLYLLVRWTAAAPPSRWVAFGVALGVASLVRGVALPFLVVPAVVWTLTAGLRAALARAVLVTLGLALVVLPWTARNLAVMGAPILLSTDGAYALFNGHNPLASGTQSADMNELRKKEWPWLERLPYPQREVAQARVELRYGLRYLFTHPGHELALIPQRIYYLFAHDHHALIPASPPRRLTIGETRVGPDLDALGATVADAYFFAVTLLALIGLTRVLHHGGPMAWLLALTVAYFTVLHGVLFFGDARYHAPLVPVLCILAAWSVTSLRRRGRSWTGSPASWPGPSASAAATAGWPPSPSAPA